MSLGTRLGTALRAGVLACAALAGLALPARAQIGSDRYSAMVVDQRSGAILVSANADEQRHPASLTKMMTLYMLFEALREGRINLDSRITFSEEAASRPPSKLGIPAGHSITVEQAILALVTRSANDVASAVGERLGGTEERFAQMMTLRARSIGMSRTTFRNASGLPDPDQVTTARDMTTLGRRLFADFPDRWHYFSVATAQFGGMRIRNHNRMLETYEGVDGIKTGYIRDSGFNIVTSASRGGQRLIGAVFGGSSWVERDAHMASLLDQGFSQLGVTAARGSPGLLRTAHAGTLGPANRGAAAAPAQRQASASRTTRLAATRSAAAVQPSRAAPTRRTARHTVSHAAPAPTRSASRVTHQASPRLPAPRQTAVALPPPVPPLRTAALR